MAYSQILKTNRTRRVVPNQYPQIPLQVILFIFILQGKVLYIKEKNNA